MRSRKELLKDELELIQITEHNTLPVHTEILLDIRDLLIDFVKLQKGVKKNE